ncbi:MAG: hypothetical protein HW411_752 [Gammaproteobacteria bacterium]|nr:hypothetical protein [Gammaproteobacteria bacterium]
MKLKFSLKGVKKYYLHFFVIFSMLGILGVNPKAEAEPGVEFKGMLFFEGQVNPTYIPQWEELTTIFYTSTSRYIYTMIQLNNLKYQISEQPVSITLKYFKPDGTNFGEPVINYTIPADWDVAELWQGWGWADAGYWEAGDWRVEAWLNNSEKLGEYSFKVVSN